MKRMIFFLVCVCLVATKAYTQEVRGVETRIAEYVGDKYGCYINNHDYMDTVYYGFELTNKNSITVSVSVEIYQRNDEGKDKLVATKDIVLASGESYIVKNPKMPRYNEYSKPGKYEMPSTLNYSYKYGKSYTEYFYVIYKAYKML